MMKSQAVPRGAVVLCVVFASSFALPEHTKLISHLIDPYTIDHFHEVHWERTPHAWLRDDSKHFEKLKLLSRATRSILNIEQWLPYCKSTQPGLTHGKDML